MLWTIKTLSIITYVTALRYVHYPVELFVAALNRFTAIGLITLFWFIVARYSDAGLDVASLIGYFLIVSGLTQFMLGGLSGSSSVLKKIKLGTLNAYLVRPVHPFFYMYYQQVGYMAPFVLVSFVLVILGMFVSAPVNLSPLLIFITIICALSINMAFNMLVGCIAFYVVEAGGIKNTFAHIISFSQGFLIPVFLTPEWWQQFVFASPFAASLYNPVRALQGQPVEGWHVMVGIFWAIILLPAAMLLWIRSIRRYEGVGI